MCLSTDGIGVFVSSKYCMTDRRLLCVDYLPPNATSSRGSSLDRAVLALCRLFGCRHSKRSLLPSRTRCPARTFPTPRTWVPRKSSSTFSRRCVRSLISWTGSSALPASHVVRLVVFDPLLHCRPLRSVGCSSPSSREISSARCALRPWTSSSSSSSSCTPGRPTRREVQLEQLASPTLAPPYARPRTPHTLAGDDDDHSTPQRTATHASNMVLRVAEMVTMFHHSEVAAAASLGAASPLRVHEPHHLPGRALLNKHH